MAPQATTAKLAEHLGKSLRAARQRAKLTQEKVAELVDIAPEVYGRIERGKGLLRVDTLHRLCHVLQADANVVLALGAHEPLGWREGSEPPQEDSLQVRRLLGSLREMNKHQMMALNYMVRSMLKHNEERMNRPVVSAIEAPRLQQRD
jgi:transcriptional regulator with XRE-family HTH domain